MSTMNLKLKKENAVSPVVGVMLMLVVTIIIAAVVAAFAGGLVGETKPASTVSIGLDDYTMATVNYTSGGWSGPYGIVEYAVGFNTSLTGGDYSNYAPYNMTFKHMGGAELDVSDLSLVITYNAASYTTPLSQVTDEDTFSAGDIIILNANTTATVTDSRLLGLSKQSFYDFYGSTGLPTFTWAIKDSSDYVIAKGTAKTLAP